MFYLLKLKNFLRLRMGKKEKIFVGFKLIIFKYKCIDLIFRD